MVQWLRHRAPNAGDLSMLELGPGCYVKQIMFLKKQTLIMAGANNRLTKKLKRTS